MNLEPEDHIVKGMHKVVKTNAGTIEYTSYGDGIPVLFVHGGHVSCNFTLPHKGFDIQKYQLITPSRPGYGNTPLDNNGTPYQAARLFIALLDWMNIDKVIVYGISAGGLTALELAGNFSDRVSKLILGSAVTKDWLDKKGKTYIGAKMIFSSKVDWLTWGMIRLMCSVAPGLVAKTFHPAFSIKRDKLPGNEISELVKHLRTFRSKKGFVNDIDQTIAVETLRKIVCPTLLLHSKNDTSVPIDHVQHAKREIKNSKMLLFDNLWGHMIWIGKDYALIQKEIINFIDDL